MKNTRNWILSVIIKVLVVLLVIVLFPYAKNLFRLNVPDATGEIRTQSRIIEQKLESSQRLEVTTVDEQGIMEADTNVIIFGTVGKTIIRYRYTASVGIELKDVIMTVDSDRIILSLPEIIILNDGIEALEVTRHNLFSKKIEKSVETLLAEQRNKCREKYITDVLHSRKAKDDTVKAFNETICKWLEDFGERHYEIEIIFSDETAAR